MRSKISDALYSKDELDLYRNNLKSNYGLSDDEEYKHHEHIDVSAEF